MKFVFILVVIVCVSIQEYEANPEDVPTRKFALNLPSVKYIFNVVQDALDNFNTEFENTLKGIKTSSIKNLHERLSSENYHFRAIVLRAQETTQGGGDQCDKELNKMFDLFKNEYEKSVKGIQEVYSKHSRINTNDQILRDMPKGYNIIEWVWYVVKWPISAFQVYLEASKSAKEMQEEMSKRTDYAMTLIRKETNEFLTKEFYPCLDNINKAPNQQTTTDLPLIDETAPLFP